MAINDALYIWVADVKKTSHYGFDELRGFIINGTKFETNFDFGILGARYFEGKLSFLSLERRITLDAKLSHVHIHNKGYSWHLDVDSSLMLPPFLISSNTQLKLISRSSVLVYPTEEMKELIWGEGLNAEFLVGCNKWIGILTINSWSHDSIVGALYAFSDKFITIDQVSTIRELEIDEPFGEIRKK